MVIKDNILVSVCMITYKHEEFIEQAINSILMQKIDFNLELLISDDNSPDNTEKIVTRIRENHIHGNKINYVRHKENKGMLPNFNWALNHCKGKYIALCEGDDYWTDPLKLQKQVDFLETNEMYAACFHRAIRLEGSTESLMLESWRENKAVSDETIISGVGGVFPTASLVFRREVVGAMLNVHSRPFSGDWMLSLYILLKGKFYFLSDIMSVYRVHEGGML